MGITGNFFKILFKKKGKGIGLALGGGSIRGVAHVGVLKALEKHGIKPAYLTGNSAGAIVAALYASGLSIEEVEQIALKLDWLHLVFPTKSGLGLFSGKRLEDILKKNLPVETFGESRIPLKIVAADLLSGKEYVFEKPNESIAFAVRASSAIPGIFAPVNYKKMLLVDGCLLNNLPVSLLDDFNPAMKIAVNVVPDVSIKEMPAGIFNQGLFSLISRSNDLYILNNLNSAVKNCDLLISPLKKYISPVQFNNKINKELIAMGEMETEKYIGLIKRYA
jgi:NTE family protein